MDTTNTCSSTGIPTKVVPVTELENKTAVAFDKAMRGLFLIAETILQKRYAIDIALGTKDSPATLSLNKYKKIYGGSKINDVFDTYRKHFTALFNKHRIDILAVLDKTPKENWLYSNSVTILINDSPKFKDYAIRLSMIYRDAVTMGDEAAAANLNIDDLNYYAHLLLAIYEVFSTCDVTDVDASELKGIVDFMKQDLGISTVRATGNPIADMFNGDALKNIAGSVLNGFGFGPMLEQQGGIDGIMKKVMSDESKATLGGMVEKLQGAGNIQEGIQMFMNDMKENPGVGKVIANALGPIQGMAAAAGAQVAEGGEAQGMPEPIVGIGRMLQDMGISLPGLAPPTQDDSSSSSSSSSSTTSPVNLDDIPTLTPTPSSIPTTPSNTDISQLD